MSKSKYKVLAETDEQSYFHRETSPEEIYLVRFRNDSGLVLSVDNSPDLTIRYGPCFSDKVLDDWCAKSENARAVITLIREIERLRLQLNPPAAIDDSPVDATDKIRAYRVRELGEEKGGYYDASAMGVGSFIETYIAEAGIGSGYTITVEEVSKEWLENLPEFDGF